MDMIVEFIDSLIKNTLNKKVVWETLKSSGAMYKADVCDNDNKKYSTTLTGKDDDHFGTFMVFERDDERCPRLIHSSNNEGCYAKHTREMLNQLYHTLYTIVRNQNNDTPTKQVVETEAFPVEKFLEMVIKKTDAGMLPWLRLGATTSMQDVWTVVVSDVEYGTCGIEIVSNHSTTGQRYWSLGSLKIQRNVASSFMPPELVYNSATSKVTVSGDVVNRLYDSVCKYLNYQASRGCVVPFSAPIFDPLGDIGFFSRQRSWYQPQQQAVQISRPNISILTKLVEFSEASLSDASKTTWNRHKNSDVFELTDPDTNVTFTLNLKHRKHSLDIQLCATYEGTEVTVFEYLDIDLSNYTKMGKCADPDNGWWMLAYVISLAYECSKRREEVITQKLYNLYSNQSNSGRMWNVQGDK